MSGYNLRGQQNAVGDILGHLTGHIVTLYGIDGGVFIGILLLDLFVIALNQAEDAVVSGVGLAQKAAGIAVGNVFLGDFKGAMGHNGFFYQVLDFFHGRAAPHFFTGDLYPLGNTANLKGGQTDLFIGGLVGLGDGCIDFLNVKVGFGAVSFDNLHADFLLSHEWVSTCSEHIIHYILCPCQ